MFLRLAALTALALAPSQAMAAWNEAKSNHFIVYSQLSQDKLRSYVNHLERYDAAVRVVRQMKDPPPTSTSRVTLYVLRDEGEVQNVTGISGIAGDECSNDRSSRIVRLHQHSARLVAAAGPARHLLDLLEAALCCAEVAAGKAEVGIDDAD